MYTEKKGGDMNAMCSPAPVLCFWIRYCEIKTTIHSQIQGCAMDARPPFPHLFCQFHAVLG